MCYFSNWSGVDFRIEHSRIFDILFFASTFEKIFVGTMSDCLFIAFEVLHVFNIYWIYLAIYDNDNRKPLFQRNAKLSKYAQLELLQCILDFWKNVMDCP